MFFILMSLSHTSILLSLYLKENHFHMSSLYLFIPVGVTGNALPLDIEYFLDSGANAVLTKPIDTEKLKRLLGN